MQSQGYLAATRRFERIKTLDDAIGILGWDSQTKMPVGAAENRSEQLAMLKGLSHELLTAPAARDELDHADTEQDSLGQWERANLREMRRAFRQASAVPADLVLAGSKATSSAELAWREARATGDFLLLQPHLEEVLRLQRDIASCKGGANGQAPYDALLDQYEPGMSQSLLDPIFERLRGELPGLIEDARQLQERGPKPLTVAGPFAIETQELIARSLMARLGFDFERGRLDTSLHPFCGGASNDVRITTRYKEEDFTRALMGVLHETGHALYEQGRPRAWLKQPVGEARGMAVHESQSLLIEMQACRSREFLSFLAPFVAEAFGRSDDDAFAADNLVRLLTRVEPGFIRVDADEVTYPAHILVRYDLERAMIAGDLAVKDLPGAFNDSIRATLGLTIENDADGCLQDIHWPSGGWGYFPTYTVGAIMAAQLFERVCGEDGTIRPALANGDFSGLIAWLREQVHAKASLLSADDLVTAATGKRLSIEPYLNHLRRRYCGAA